MERINFRYEQDEQKCFLLLANQGSISCTLFKEWHLSRAIIKGALQDLFYNRRLQVTLASILVGTRFKSFDKLIGGGSTRLPTVCKICGARDSPAHLTEHAGLKPPKPDPIEIVEFLVQLAKTADTYNPHVSIPLQQEVSGDFELQIEGEDDSSSIESLSFEVA